MTSSQETVCGFVIRIECSNKADGHIVLWHKDANGIQVAKLCDLGLAKVENKIVSRHSRGLGTESHMAPVSPLRVTHFEWAPSDVIQEVLDGGHPTMKGDVFSLAGNKIVTIGERWTLMCRSDH